MSHLVFAVHLACAANVIASGRLFTLMLDSLSNARISGDFHGAAIETRLRSLP